jgi:predicted DsbA family dithiol-disulfide isomerase
VLARLKKAAGNSACPGEIGRKPITAGRLRNWENGPRKGKGDEFHNAVFRAYFVEGRNIAKKEVLSDLAGSVGLVKEEAMRSWNQEASRRLWMKTGGFPGNGALPRCPLS